jgi:aryl-alcohol dehydrogenase-like predicted oxidoreductase
VRKIGSLTVSEVGLGCNNFGRRIDYPASAVVIDTALESGINFFDTADVYGDGQSESFIGRALGSRRTQVVIATKFGNAFGDQTGGAKPAYIRQAAEASLRRLGTDYIDLYQLHIPDKNTPIAETLDTLNELVREGKVREIGCSNFSADQLREAKAVLKPDAARFVSVQNEYSLFKRDAEHTVLPESTREEIAFLPYFPLASGLLTGKYRQGQPIPPGTRLAGGGRFADLVNPQNLAVVESLIQFAEQHQHTILDLAFAWLLRWSVVASVIAGATKPDQVKANVAATGWTLTDDAVREIETIVSRLIA